jgi:hypothetical protein
MSDDDLIAKSISRFGPHAVALLACSRLVTFAERLRLPRMKLGKVVRREGARKEPYRSSVKVVAGEGLEPPTLGL